MKTRMDISEVIKFLEQCNPFTNRKPKEKVNYIKYVNYNQPCTLCLISAIEHFIQMRDNGYKNCELVVYKTKGIYIIEREYNA